MWAWRESGDEEWLAGGCRMEAGWVTVGLGMTMGVKDKPQWVRKGGGNGDEEGATVDGGG